MSDTTVIDWLLDPETSDPSIRWQVMRDLLDAPRAEWEAERAKVETQGWGARLLAHQDEDGQWAGGAFFPKDFTWGEEEGQPWTATYPTLNQLRELGVDPSSDRMRTTVTLLAAHSRWDHDGQPFWEGEVEPCINGQSVANGVYFGVDMSPLVERLVEERLDDGAGTARRRTAPSARRSTPPSTSWRDCWNMRAQLVGPRLRRRRVAPVRSTSCSATCSVG